MSVLPCEPSGNRRPGWRLKYKIIYWGRMTEKGKQEVVRVQVEHNWKQREEGRGAGDAFHSPTALSWFWLAQHKLSVWWLPRGHCVPGERLEFYAKILSPPTGHCLQNEHLQKTEKEKDSLQAWSWALSANGYTAGWLSERGHMQHLSGRRWHVLYWWWH